MPHSNVRRGNWSRTEEDEAITASVLTCHPAGSPGLVSDVAWAEGLGRAAPHVTGPCSGSARAPRRRGVPGGEGYIYLGSAVTAIDFLRVVDLLGGGEGGSVRERGDRRWEERRRLTPPLRTKGTTGTKEWHQLRRRDRGGRATRVAIGWRREEEEEEEEHATAGRDDGYVP